MAGVNRDVLDVHVIGFHLAAEGDDDADDLIIVEDNGAGVGEQFGVQPVVGGRAWPHIRAADRDELLDAGNVGGRKRCDDHVLIPGAVVTLLMARRWRK